MQRLGQTLKRMLLILTKNASKIFSQHKMSAAAVCVSSTHTHRGLQPCMTDRDGYYFFLAKEKYVTGFHAQMSSSCSAGHCLVKLLIKTQTSRGEAQLKRSKRFNASKQHCFYFMMRFIIEMYFTVFIVLYILLFYVRGSWRLWR